MREDASTASDMLWVTNTMVLPGFPKLVQLGVESGARLLVERGKRFVHEHHVGVHGQKPRNRHALLLTSGKRAGAPVGQVAEPDCDKSRQGGLLSGPFVEALSAMLHAVFQREHDVLLHGKPGEQAVLRKDHAAVGVRLHDGFPLIGNAFERRLREARHHAEGNRLAAARGPDQTHELAALD